MGETVAETSEEQEFAELLGFLQDPKLEVQRFAAEGVLAQTDSQEFLEYCRRQPRKAARPLLRLAEKAEADAATSGAAAAVAASAENGQQGQRAARIAALEAATASAAGSSALQALVNLSTVPAIRDELVELSAPRRAAEALRGGWLEGRAGLAHWYAMLLANITTAKAGQEALCADESMLRFLLGAYVSKPRPAPRDGFEDPLLFLGKALGNACALEAGRRLLAGGAQGPATVATLAAELADRARRPDVICALRNLCLDPDCHAPLIAADPLASLARFLYPWEKVSAEARAQLPEALGASLAADGAALTGDAPVRFSAAMCFLGLGRTGEGREYLRAHGACEVLRAWLEEEGEEETRGALESALASLSQSEGELRTQRERQARQEEAEQSSAEARAPPARAPAEAVPAPAEAAQPAAATPAPGPRQPAGAEGPSGREEEGARELAGIFDHIEGVLDGSR